MLLTLKPPAHDGSKSFHEASLHTSPATNHFAPMVNGAALPPSSHPGSIINRDTTAATDPNNHSARPMSTAHRGLPPPAAMTLPAPASTSQGPGMVGQNPSAIQAPPASAVPGQHHELGQLPAPPSEWRHAEDSMRNWLQAKQEEDKRRQEEEKTRQEGLRLEQRRIEHSMLHESLQGGIPPHMIPMVFAGMSGGAAPAASAEWTQHYMVEWHQAQQQQQQLQQQRQAQQQQGQPQSLPQPQGSPEIRRETRAVGQPQPNPYASQPPPSAMQAGPLQPQPGKTQQSAQQAQPPGATFLPPYQPASMSPLNRGSAQAAGAAPTSAPRPQPHGVLPRLNTGEMQIQQPPGGSGGRAGGSALHPLHQSQTTSQTSSQQDTPQSQSSPNIYFHHWVPPSAHSKDKEPSTPSDYTSSPKKRKTASSSHSHSTTTVGTSAPSNPSYVSPSFSQPTSAASTPSRPHQTQSRAPRHERNRSDASSRGGTYDFAGRHRLSTDATASSGDSRAGQQSRSHSDVSMHGLQLATPPHPPAADRRFSGDAPRDRDHERDRDMDVDRYPASHQRPGDGDRRAGSPAR